MTNETNDTIGNEFLAFKLEQEEYAIDILRVQEIRGYESVTRMANAPDYIKGIVNLRGVIVPVMDLRILFQSGAPSYDQFTVVIILNLNGKVVGMVVDSVSDVIRLTSEQIKPVPEVGMPEKGEYLMGVGTIEDRILMILDSNNLLSGEVLSMAEKLAA